MSDLAVQFDEVVARRRSLRAFLEKPVPQALLEQVFGTALRAPSNCNTQPWFVHVASGAVIEDMRKHMPARFASGDISLDFPYDGKYDGVYKERQYAAAQALYDSMGIGRDEKDKRQVAFMRNFTFFDAPHVAFFFLPEPFGLREACDLGMFAQTVMLGMTAHGLGSCPQTALGFQANYVREALGVDESNKLMFGLSFGFPDPAAVVNDCVTDRATVEQVVSFHE